MKRDTASIRRRLTTEPLSKHRPWGEEHYAWKGDAARTQTKRERAQKRYELGPCELCDEPAHDRHHIDGDTGNNERSNIAILCRRCHMAADGRLDRFRELAAENARRLTKDPEPCVICGELAKPQRKGRCSKCSDYLRRRGVERPERLWV